MKSFLSLCLVIFLSVQANTQKAGAQNHPTFPRHPGNPGNPAIPVFPGNPGNPAIPVYPGNPGNPAIPGHPGKPAKPGFPGFPGLPPKKCDTCAKLKTGFSQTLHYLEQIYNKIDTHFPVTPCPPALILEVGDPSPVMDDGQSVATCPAGTAVVSCRCSKENDQCDGSRVTGLTGRTCTAFNTAGHSSPIQAIAQCAQAPLGKFTIQEVPTVPPFFSQNPVATCPAGSQVYACFLQNPWTQVIFVQTELDPAANACRTTASCTGGNGCRIQALCKTTP